MREVQVENYGGPDVLQVHERPAPEPGPGEVRVALSSIGLNHAELMARRGEYKLASGEPPFVPGLEGGGLIEARGPDVTDRQLGERVVLSLDAPRSADQGGEARGGTYRSHFVCRAEQALPAPDAIPDEQLGAVLLPFLTAWGCLAWKHGLREGETLALPAASSSTALAAAQVARHLGGRPFGLTRSQEKAERLRNLETAAYEAVLVTDHENWHRTLREMVGDPEGADVFLDPVAAGPYLEHELRALARHGTIWLYGLLGEKDAVDLSPLIRKHGALRGWALTELVRGTGGALAHGHIHVLRRLADGTYRQPVERTFSLEEAAEAHAFMERGEHVGKLVLVP
jgi:NADPH:quinone reductase-like Zn-dependent oxidoreductase